MEVVKAASALAAAGRDVIYLCVGQPSTPAPYVVREAAARAVVSEVLGYTEAAGTPGLRAVIAAHYRDRYGVTVDPGDIIVTTGSSGGFVLALLAACSAGDAVAMTRPGYPAYRNDVLALGCRVLDVAAGPAERYQPTVALLEALPEVPQALVLASPSNPTGTIIDPAELGRVAAWCAAHDCVLLSDEIYHGISFARPTATAWEFGRSAVVIGSVSKYYSMTGWRLGWLLAPPELRPAIEALQSNLAICAPAVSQAAALAAFGPEARAELDAHVARYAANRDVFLDRVGELGVTRFAPPDGAFYAYCDVSHLTGDSMAWCAEALQATGVALAPGVDFDPVDGHTTVRLSLCGDTADLNEGLDRLAAWL
jgi:aspartate/methionine/tyrosine aminotransferase